MPQETSALDALPRLRSLAEVAELVAVVNPLYVRFSGGPDKDRSTVSRDHESGCLLPGLSVNPMNPEPWWDRPAGCRGGRRRPGRPPAGVSRRSRCRAPRRRRPFRRR